MEARIFESLGTYKIPEIPENTLLDDIGFRNHKLGLYFVIEQRNKSPAKL